MSIVAMRWVPICRIIHAMPAVINHFILVSAALDASGSRVGAFITEISGVGRVATLATARAAAAATTAIRRAVLPLRTIGHTTIEAEASSWPAAAAKAGAAAVPTTRPTRSAATAPVAETSTAAI
jgi:hypothetical protein